jgi:hypothetical protein
LNICENSIRNKILPQFIPSKYIIDQHWRAFYCALREHLEINISNSIIPHIDNEILKEKWIPLQKLYNFQKEFNKVFLKYNILIPLGELQWV